MIIRRPDVSDAAYMIEYLNAVGGESDNLLFGEGEFHLTVEQEKEHIRKINSEQESYMVIGIINGKLASISQISGSVRKRIAHNCELSISVRKEFWGIGAGSAILDDLISHAKESGRFKNINLGVRSCNDNAVKLYEKFGFVKSGVHKDYIRIGENFYDEILMDLNL
jgi:RimJ/RimL family protein N-acetyltransferase